MGRRKMKKNTKNMKITIRTITVKKNKMPS